MTTSNPEMPPSDGGTATPASYDGVRLARIALTVAVLLGIVLGGILAVEWFVVKRLPELTPAALTAAEERWDERGPASYDLDLEIEGGQPGVVHVEVRDGITTAMQRDGRTPSQRRVWDVWSVPGMFDTIEREFDIAADPLHEMGAAIDTRVQLRAEFDNAYGYPARFHRITFGGGTEVYWKVTSFVTK
jgi:hypothetical protein